MTQQKLVTIKVKDAVKRICPFCHDRVQALEVLVLCADCSAVQHLECWQENGSCASCGSSKVKIRQRDRNHLREQQGSSGDLATSQNLTNSSSTASSKSSAKSTSESELQYSEGPALDIDSALETARKLFLQVKSTVLGNESAPKVDAEELSQALNHVVNEVEDNIKQTVSGNLGSVQQLLSAWRDNGFYGVGTAKTIDQTMRIVGSNGLLRPLKLSPLIELGLGFLINFMLVCILVATSLRNFDLISQSSILSGILRLIAVAYGSVGLLCFFAYVPVYFFHPEVNFMSDEDLSSKI